MLCGLERHRRVKERLSLASLSPPAVLAGVPVVTLTCNLSFSSTGPGRAPAVQPVCAKDGRLGDSEPVNFALCLPGAVCPGGTLSSDHPPQRLVSLGVDVLQALRGPWLLVSITFTRSSFTHSSHSPLQTFALVSLGAECVELPDGGGRAWNVAGGMFRGHWSTFTPGTSW